MATVITRFKVDTTQYDAGIKKAKGQLSAFGKSGAGAMNGFTQAISANVMKFASWTAVIAGAGKVIGDIVRTNKEFEQSNANLAAVLGTTRDKISTLTDDAKKLGAATMYTASQVTSLQTELAKLGFNQSEIKNATKDVLNFAAATGADLAGSASLCGAALRSFGLESKDMGRVASAMAVATSKSALSYEKLSNSLSTVAPVAAKFGFTIEDTLALLGKLSDAGFDASSAATATRNIFLNMANSSGKLATALGRPIKSLDDLAPALAELNAKGVDLAEMLNLTDKRSVAAFATLVSGSNKLIDLRDSITDCSVALQGMVDTQMNTLEGSTKILESAWEGLMLTFSNSNGVLKGVVDGLSGIIQKYTEFRKLQQGGDAAIGVLEKGITNEQKQSLSAQIDAQRAGGKTDAEIKTESEERIAQLEQEKEKLTAAWAAYEAAKNGDWRTKAEARANLESALGFSLQGKNEKQSYYQGMAGLNDQITQQQYIGDMVTTQSVQASATESTQIVETAEQKLSTKILQIKNQEAKDIAAIDREKFKTEEEYENEVYRIKRESLLKQKALYAEGGDKYIQTDTAISNLDISHQARLNRGFKEETPDLSLLDQRNEKIKEITANMEYMQSVLDSEADANTKAWATDQLQSYQAELDKLNGKVKETAQEIVKVPDAMESLSKSTNAMSNLLNGLNSIKSAGEDLADVFSGEMDAWDSLMTIMQTGVGVLQTVMSMYEAINTLTEMGTALKMAHAAAAQAEATTAVAAAGEEVAAEGAVTAASATATGVKAGEAAAGAGSAMSGIPIVGPILAVAAVAAVLAAVISAVNKSKSSAGSYAEGGIVPGNSYSGDRLTASVNSGELILSRSQQANLASQLSAGSSIANGQLSTRIKGGDILIALDNTNRSRGGSRGTYAYSK